MDPKKSKDKATTTKKPFTNWNFSIPTEIIEAARAKAKLMPRGTLSFQVTKCLREFVQEKQADRGR